MTVWVAGADGLKSRWIVVLRLLGADPIRVRTVDAFSELLTLPEQPAVVAVDIPIGLPETTMSGGRSCDRAARRMLGIKRSSVFSPIGRLALTATSRLGADGLNRAAGGIGVGAQAWGLATKLREADRAMTPARQAVVHEAHPELSFAAMQGGMPCVSRKRTEAGLSARVALLIQSGFSADFLVEGLAQRRAGRDDFLDACAVCWTAERISLGTAGRLPEVPERDARGLDMAIWF